MTQFSPLDVDRPTVPGSAEAPAGSGQTISAGRVAGRRRRSWRLLLNAGVSGICLYFVLRQAAWHDIVAATRALDFRPLVLPLLLTVAALPLRPLRWQLIFPKALRPRFITAFCVTAIGNMVNNILPARGGDIVRCVMISPNAAISATSTAMATLALEKILDGLGLGLVLVAGVYLLGPPAWVGWLAAVSMGVFVCAFVFLALMRSFPRAVVRVVEHTLVRLRCPRLGRRLSDLIGSFIKGLATVGSVKQFARLGLLTALIWVVDAVGVWGLAHSLGLSLALHDALIVSAVIGLGLTIPAGPAGVGTYEAFAVAALALYSVPKEVAVSFAILGHLWAFLQTNGLGLSCLIVSRFGFGELTHLTSGHTGRSDTRVHGCAMTCSRP